MQKVLKTVKKIMNVICWIMIIALVAVMSVSFITQITGNTPSLFGYSLYRVSSGSMQPELMVGDIILDKVVENPEALKEGDIITYEGNGVLDGQMVTHKVIKAPYTEDGKQYIQTQGVANPIPDDPIELDRVRGIMLCEIPILTMFFILFLSPWGFLIVIGLILFIFVDELITVIKILTGNDKSAKEAEDINDIIGRIQSDSADKDEEN